MFKKTLVALAVLSCSMTSFAYTLNANQVTISNNTSCSSDVNGNIRVNAYTAYSKAASQFTGKGMTFKTNASDCLQGNATGNVVITNSSNCAGMVTIGKSQYPLASAGNPNHYANNLSLPVANFNGGSMITINPNDCYGS